MDAEIPILCFHPPTPPSPSKVLTVLTLPTPPASPPLQRPPPPILEPDAPSDALDHMEIDDGDAVLESPPVVLSRISDPFNHGVPALCLGVREGPDSEHGTHGTATPAAAWPPSPLLPSTPALVTARDSWVGAQHRRASASAMGEFKISKHEQDWAAAETYVSSLEDSLMALYRCLENMDIEGRSTAVTAMNDYANKH